MNTTIDGQRGDLFLIPTPITPDGLETLPGDVVKTIHQLRHFIVENARTARRFIKSTNPPYRIEELDIQELRREASFDLVKMMAPVISGHSIGLMSEAGCPSIADPGAHVVRYAHDQGILIKPLVGPSSITLALMASGMNGQQFCFHGYLTAKRDKLPGVLKRLESDSQRQRRTQIFIEAPYRNRQIYSACLETLSSSTHLCVATHLTAGDQFIRTARISEWSASEMPDFHKKPTIFLLYAG